MAFVKTSDVNADIFSRTRRRPPGALDEVLLDDTCTGCGDCVSVCPGALILLDREGFPLLMSSSLCTRCGLCAEVCTPGAIELTEATRAGLARILAADRRRSLP